MISLYVWILLFKEAFGSISIKVEPLVVKIDKSDIDIRCMVDGTTLTSILSIQLIRSNTTVVTVTKNRVAWEDAALENKTGVTVNASITNVMSSYLHLEILKTVVRYPDSFGSYQCSLLALDSLGGLVNYHSLIVNITGLPETTIDTRDFTTAFSTEQFVQEGTFKSNISGGTFISNVTDGPSDHNISKILQTYRAVMTPLKSFFRVSLYLLSSVKYVCISLQRIGDSLDKIVFKIQF
ncbi:uncharacterized protein LOC128159404 [Crassostrea angulata]|uniref:uncharacterized protein LOC128159404 n=1 Tax=Magallana angulata TaxID=2784310 RepID=UPI0022B1663B|nr:uncharacterized protein LOC128159404 [Crassostrea angulata]